MGPTLLLVLLLLALFALSAYVNLRVSRAAGARAAARHASDAAHIQQTGRPPEGWVNAAAGTRGSEERIRASLLRRLDTLSRDYARLPLSSDDRARLALLDNLAAAREKWETAEISALREEGRE